MLPIRLLFKMMLLGVLIWLQGTSSFGQLTPVFSELWHTSNPNAIVDALGQEDGSTLVAGSVVRRDANGNEHYHAILQKFDVDYELLWEWTSSDPMRIQRIASITVDPYGRIVMIVDSKNYIGADEERELVVLSPNGIEVRRLTPENHPNASENWFTSIVADSSRYYLQVLETGSFNNLQIAFDTLGNKLGYYGAIVLAPSDIQYDEKSNTVLTHTENKDLQISYNTPTGIVLGQQIRCLDLNCQNGRFFLPGLRTSYFIRTNKGIRFPKLENINNSIHITSLTTLDRDSNNFNLTDFPLDATYSGDFKSLRPWGVDSLLIETVQTEFTTFSVVDLDGKLGRRLQSDSYLMPASNRRNDNVVLKERSNISKRIRYLSYVGLEKYSSIIDASLNDTINPYTEQTSFLEHRKLRTFAPHPDGYLISPSGVSISSREIILSVINPSNDYEVVQTLNFDLGVDTVDLADLAISEFEISPTTSGTWAEFIISLVYYNPDIGGAPVFKRFLYRVDSDFQIISVTEVEDERANMLLFTTEAETSTILYFVIQNNTRFLKVYRVSPIATLQDSLDINLTTTDNSTSWKATNLKIANNNTIGFTERITDRNSNSRIVLSTYDTIGTRLLSRSSLSGDIPFCFDSSSNLVTLSLNTSQTLDIKTYLASTNYSDSTISQVTLPSSYDTIFHIDNLDSSNILLAVGFKNDEFLNTSVFRFDVTTSQFTPLHNNAVEYSLAYKSDIKIAEYGYTIQGNNITDRLALIYALPGVTNTSSPPTVIPTRFSISPNPSKGGELSLQQLSETRAVSYDLIAPNGTLLTQQQDLRTNSMIPLPQAAGMYFIRITDTEGGVTVLKHVVR